MTYGPVPKAFLFQNVVTTYGSIPHAWYWSRATADTQLYSKRKTYGSAAMAFWFQSVVTTW